jgi:hypothetical protein
MNRLITVLGGAAAVAVAGAALDAGSNRHVMNVPLADGIVVHVEYVGDVAPKVTLAPGGVAGPAWAPVAFPAFPAMPDMGPMIEQLNRQTSAMAQQIQQMARRGAVGGPANLAAYGSVPTAANSVSVVSVSNGAGTCTRTTRVVSQGAGQPPKVTTEVSGNCVAGPAVAPAPVPAPGAAPGRAPAALDRT